MGSDLVLVNRRIRLRRGPLHLAAANRRLQGARHVALPNGIELPFRISYAWLDGRDPIILNHIMANVPVSEAKFGRPAPLKA